MRQSRVAPRLIGQLLQTALQPQPDMPALWKLAPRLSAKASATPIDPAGLHGRSRSLLPAQALHCACLILQAMLMTSTGPLRNGYADQQQAAK